MQNLPGSPAARRPRRPTAPAPRLPAPRTGPTGAMCRTRGDSCAMSRPRRVLLIDDNIDAGESLAPLLALSGHAARTPIDGPAGLRLAAEFAPEVVFCDLGLPG